MPARHEAGEQVEHLTVRQIKCIRDDMTYSDVPIDDHLDSQLDDRTDDRPLTIPRPAERPIRSSKRSFNGCSRGWTTDGLSSHLMIPR